MVFKTAAICNSDSHSFCATEEKRRDVSGLTHDLVKLQFKKQIVSKEIKAQALTKTAD
jgi:hypothetical protein